EVKPEVKPEVKANVIPGMSVPVEKAAAYSSTRNNSLPTTGDKESIATVLGLSLLVASGLASIRRKISK
ncbi:TPA: LPXTG cell wall anchor domain-containing protein, partial [Streptococcus suis]|nr:LPXTG cell wall anchor domain-containing protein [Streptococcus suis]